MSPDWFAANAPTATAPSGDDWFASNNPLVFKSTNAKDEQGNAVVSGVSKVWETLNTSPVAPYIHDAATAIAKHLDQPLDPSSHPILGSQAGARARGFMAGAVEGVGNVAESFTTPIGIALTLAGFGGESAAARSIPGAKALLELPQVRALQRAVQGTAGAGFAVHGASQVATAPTLAGQAQGVAEFAGGLAGVGGAMRPPGTVRPAGRVSRLTPEEAASNAFAESQGIPLDAATATNSRFARGVQKVAGESFLGSGPAERMQSAQREGLIQAGQKLADQTGETAPIDIQTAGAAGRAGVERLIQGLSKQSNEAYGRLRDIEAKPEHALSVMTAPHGSKAAESILSKMKEGGFQPSIPELTAMRQIEAELDMMPYQQGGTVQNASRYAGTDNDWTGGDMRSSSRVQARGGAPVYQDILQSMPDGGNANKTRAEVLAGIQKTLATGEWNDASLGALVVARERARTGKSGPSLPDGSPLLGSKVTVALPVDLKPAKSELRPLYDSWKRESEIVPLSMGGEKGRAFAALDRLMSGPDVESVSVVDQALSSLKSLSRGAEMPELRNAGQSGAARAVAQIESAVRQAVAKAGPGATDALLEGRHAYKTMREVETVLDDIQKEPAQAFQRLTARGDAQASLLRRVTDAAPDAGPTIARAWLDQQLATATERGRFEHTDKLFADWQKMGPETKKLLFPDAAHRKALGDFFLLAKRLNENVNPSGTANTTAKTGEMVSLGAGVLSANPVMLAPSLTMGLASKLLYSPAGARALARYAQRTARPGVVSAAARRAAWIELAAAAKRAGVSLEPQTADTSDQPTP